MNIGKLIRDRRNELNLTLEDVGNAVGVTKSTVKKWEDGFISNMKRDKLAELAKVLQLDPVVFITGEANSYSYAPPSNVFPISVKRFPILGEIACGEPIYADENHESYIIANANIKADFCLVAKGDSMINARINDGDIVFIRSQPTVENGDIAAVIIGDEATLKRVYIKANVVTLIAENPKYEPMVYTGDELESIRILGKAVCFMSNL